MEKGVFGLYSWPVWVLERLELCMGRLNHRLGSFLVVIFGEIVSIQLKRIHRRNNVHQISFLLFCFIQFQQRLCLITSIYLHIVQNIPIMLREVAHRAIPSIFSRVAIPSPVTTSPRSLLSFSRSWHSGTDLTGLDDTQPGTFVDSPLDLLPEAESKFYEDPKFKEIGAKQPDYSCKGARQAFDFLGGQRSLLYRDCIKGLIEKAKLIGQGTGVEHGIKNKWYLNGGTGSGKSLTMYSLAAWARSQGWIVLYIPSAKLFLEKGYFVEDISSVDKDIYDTPMSAQTVLRNLKDNHSKELEEISYTDAETGNTHPLMHLVNIGLDLETYIEHPKKVVMAVIQIKEELMKVTHVPVMIAVDDYNALYFPPAVAYSERIHDLYLRRIEPDELRLASAFRLLEHKAPKRGLVVAAPSYSQDISPKLHIPSKYGKTDRIEVPRFSLEEIRCIAESYAAVRRGDKSSSGGGGTDISGSSKGGKGGKKKGQNQDHSQQQGETEIQSSQPKFAATTLPEWDSPEGEYLLRKALFLTRGNATEVRQWAESLFNADEGMLTLSIGYKKKLAMEKKLRKGGTELLLLGEEM